MPHIESRQDGSYYVVNLRLILPDTIFNELMTVRRAESLDIEHTIEAALAEWAGIREYRRQEQEREARRRERRELAQEEAA